MIFGQETLFIIPCCAAKSFGGQILANHADPLANSVSAQCYTDILATRMTVLKKIKADLRFVNDKYQKNVAIQDGPDVGGTNSIGNYMPAICRYDGTLYSVDGFKSSVQQTISTKDGPQILILSALYGPLHPLSPIQDYNLMMSDVPARAWSMAFPPFLEEYVRCNRIEKIILYVGTSTAYFKIAKKAVLALTGKGLILRAVQYHIENGSTRMTPLQHGRRLLDDLDRVSTEETKRSSGIVENIL